MARQNTVSKFHSTGDQKVCLIFLLNSQHEFIDSHIDHSAQHSGRICLNRVIGKCFFFLNSQHELFIDPLLKSLCRTQGQFETMIFLEPHAKHSYIIPKVKTQLIKAPRMRATCLNLFQHVRTG